MEGSQEVGKTERPKGGRRN